MLLSNRALPNIVIYYHIAIQIREYIYCIILYWKRKVQVIINVFVNVIRILALNHKLNEDLPDETDGDGGVGRK